MPCITFTPYGRLKRSGTVCSGFVGHITLGGAGHVARHNTFDRSNNSPDRQERGARVQYERLEDGLQ